MMRAGGLVRASAWQTGPRVTDAEAEAIALRRIAEQNRVERLRRAGYDENGNPLSGDA